MIKKIKLKKIVSIHGVPRSGTSWLGQIFNSSPDVKFKYQPLFSYAFKDKIDLRSNENEIRNYYKSLYDFNDEFLDQKKNIVNGLYPNFKKKNKHPDFLVTKMNRYHFLILHLMEQIDNIVFIAIVRHPCAVLNSWKNNPQEFKEGWDFKKEWRFFL